MRIIFFSSLLILISACNAKQPECNSEQVKSLVLEIYKKDLIKYLGDQSQSIKELKKNAIPFQKDSIVNSFFNNSNLEVQGAITTGKNEDLFSCSCEATLNCSISEKFKSELNRNAELTGDKMLHAMIRELDLSFDKTIVYKAQITDDREHIAVDALTINELHEALDKFIVLYVSNYVALKSNKKNM